MGLCCTKPKTHERPTSSSSNSSHNHRQETVNPTPPKPGSPKPFPASSFLPPETAPSSTQTGKILGKPYVDITKLYDLDKELGSGQFGITHLCTEKATGLKYACKSLSTRELVTDEGIENARREVTILQHLSGQPNIVEFKGAYEDAHNLHLVTEFCSGGMLFDRITARGSYSEREAARICRQILNVVKVCHFMGVMHRDLKPENLLLASMDEDAPLKVTAFGLSDFIEEGQLEMDSLNSVFVKL